jgi:hypothetical protein
LLPALQALGSSVVSLTYTIAFHSSLKKNEQQHNSNQMGAVNKIAGNNAGNFTDTYGFTVSLSFA